MPACACMIILAAFGCTCPPRPRLASYATSTIGTRFVSSDKLGSHSYIYSPFERNGITYTCKGGHIDIAHLRIAADNTKYISDKIYKGIREGKADFSFTLPGDSSKHVVGLTYPEKRRQGDKETVAREVSLKLGAYLAFSATTWHEMLTWFGHKTMVIMPEFHSAFSWEDIYSNLLGTEIAVKAMRDTEHKYNRAMTLALQREMAELGGMTGREAIEAAEKVRGKWFTGNVNVTVKKRNLDIGLDDGFVTPMLVPGVCESENPHAYPVPDGDVSQYGFDMQYHIVPNELDKSKILQIAHPEGTKKTIDPKIHFAPIIDHIRQVTINKYGPGATVADNPSVIGKQSKLTPNPDQEMTKQ